MWGMRQEFCQQLLLNSTHTDPFRIQETAVFNLWISMLSGAKCDQIFICDNALNVSLFNRPVIWRSTWELTQERSPMFVQSNSAVKPSLKKCPVSSTSKLCTRTWIFTFRVYLHLKRKCCNNDYFSNCYDQIVSEESPCSTNPVSLFFSFSLSGCSSTGAPDDSVNEMVHKM